MKAVLATILIAGVLSTSFLSHPREMTPEELLELPSNLGNLKPMFQAAKSHLNAALPQGPYDKCFDITEQALYNFVESFRAASNQDLEKARTLFIKGYAYTIQAAACFNVHFSSENSILKISPQCVVDHLNKASDELGNAFDDIKHGNWSAAAGDFNEVINTIKDIANC